MKTKSEVQFPTQEILDSLDLLTRLVKGGKPYLALKQTNFFQKQLTEFLRYRMKSGLDWSTP